MGKKFCSKGYVKGNVVAISRWANLKKSSMSIDDLKNILEYMERHIGKCNN